MTIKQQYDIKFHKQTSKGFSDYYYSHGNDSILGSLELSELLRAVSNDEAELMLEEINEIINTGFSYEESYSFNNSPISVDFNPPNVTINGTYTLPLLDLKQLLEEWIAFTQS